MFDNLLYQSAGSLLKESIEKKSLPQAILFCGPESSGKLTCALEIARVLSCKAEPKGLWTCTCSSCLKQKALNSPDVLIAGYKNCTLEISAAEKYLLQAVTQQATYIHAARYFYLRSVKKLTSRFSQVLLEDDDKLCKIAPIVECIDEYLEELDPLRNLPEIDKLSKLLSNVFSQCVKLESDFLTDSIPVSQIRKVSAWTRYTTNGNKKICILENVDKMQDSVRNALLKILEEPPKDVIFILTAIRKGSVLPTILSRVRVYNFIERSEIQQKDVISRVFHANSEQYSSINQYLATFLPVSLVNIQEITTDFFNALFSNIELDLNVITKKMNNFEPRILLKIFFVSLMDKMRVVLRESINNTQNPIYSNACKTEKAQKLLDEIKIVYENITIYNQSPIAALEAMCERLR